MTTSATAKLPKNVLPLDALRFISALFVCLYHGVKPPGNRIIPYFDLAWDSLLFGGTGVLAFFVISGFCIHYPALAGANDPKWGSFLTRRYVRVMIPYLVILPFAALAQRDYNMFTGNDLAWTILCDLAYYSMYPFLFYVGRRIGWYPILGVSFVLSAIFLWLNRDPNFDIANFVVVPIFLPSWILGCVIAEIYAKKMRGEGLRIPSKSTLYVARAGMLIVTPLMALATYEKLVPSWIYLGVPVAILVTIWIWIEICYYSDGRTIPVFLAWAGTWIYSLYLTHPVTQRGIDLIMMNYFPGVDAFMHSHFVWLSLRFVVMVAATFGAAYLFARLVEFPSHDLARWLSRRMKF